MLQMTARTWNTSRRVLAQESIRDAKSSVDRWMRRRLRSTENGLTKVGPWQHPSPRASYIPPLTRARPPPFLRRPLQNPRHQARASSRSSRSPSLLSRCPWRARRRAGAQRERDVDVSCPVSIDVRGRTRARLVFRWVVEGNRRGEVSWERWELPLLGRRRDHWRSFVGVSTGPTSSTPHLHTVSRYP